MNRRKLVTGLISFVAAPAIVRVENLMPVKVPALALEAWVPIRPKWCVLDPEMYQDLLNEVLDLSVQPPLPVMFYRQVGRYEGVRIIECDP